MGDLEITPDLIAHFLKELADRIIYVSGVSGSWNQAFSGLIKPSEDSQRQDGIETIFLASETIYSPTSIRAFTQVLMTVLMHAEETNGRAKALVAAKRMYFGVGGGIDEFITILEELGGKYNIVWETQGTGVGRVILEVVKNR